MLHYFLLFLFHGVISSADAVVYMLFHTLTFIFFD